ncbi:MAG: LysM peptidoglycan-binding domain-containing protein, partial [Sedimentisphaerales bacterium]|nr:LysM peptidoglycan-binding domain-containing protein [Sedimentisphaerales bacterium]
NEGMDSEQEEQMLLGQAGTSETAGSSGGRENLSMAAEQADQLTPNPALEPVEPTPVQPIQPTTDRQVAMEQPTLPEQMNDVRYVGDLPDVHVTPPVSRSQPMTDTPVSPTPVGEPMFRRVSPGSMIMAGGDITRGGSLPGTANITRSSDDIIVAAPRPAVRVYTVQSGDDLSKIAVKMYGTAEGNRWVNIKRIGEASGMTDLNTLRVGQKLKIPELVGVQFQGADQAGDETRLEQTISTGDLRPSSNGRTYIVKDGDSLWKIAQQELGNGARFSEISKLNKLSDEDNIKPGMKLRLP